MSSVLRLEIISVEALSNRNAENRKKPGGIHPFQKIFVLSSYYQILPAFLLIILSRACSGLTA
jgi:hypothetical protein